MLSNVNKSFWNRDVVMIITSKFNLEAEFIIARITIACFLAFRNKIFTFRHALFEVIEYRKKVLTFTLYSKLRTFLSIHNQLNIN